MRLKAVYAVWAAAIGAIVVAALAMFAAGESRRASEAHARERAGLMADLVHQSFLSLTHSSGGVSDMEEFASLLEEGRAGGIAWIKLISPEPGGSPITRLYLDRTLKEPLETENPDGFPVLEVRRPLVNTSRCSGCHQGQGDVLALLSVGVDTSASSHQAAALSARIYTTGALAACLLVLLTGLTALINRNKGAPSAQKTLSADPAAPQGFGSLFVWLRETGRRPDASSIQQMQKVEKMATIGELASAIAHEVKNPLAGISGAIQVLAESFEPVDPRRTVVGEVLSEIDRLDKTIRDLNSFARPPEPSLIRMPITEAVDRAVSLIKGQAKKQCVDVNIIRNEDMGLVLADPDQLQQVFLNIMMNALHAMPDGGTITVETGEKGKAVEIRITDTGAGVSDSEARNIFEPFYTTRTTGTGLGLAVSQNIIERHAGTLEVLGPAGTGAAFLIKLPKEEI